MGVVLNSSIDTNLGSSDKIYLRIENINLNRTFGKVTVAVTYWINQSYSETFKHSTSRYPKGQILNNVIYYGDDDIEGEEITLPVLFEFDLTTPKKIMVPLYKIEEVSEEVPYIKFDDLGRKTVAYRTVHHTVKTKIGEKEDITQVLDFNIEKTLISWCYGQIKAQLAEIIPIDILLDT